MTFNNCTTSCFWCWWIRGGRSERGDKRWKKDEHATGGVGGWRVINWEEEQLKALLFFHVSRSGSHVATIPRDQSHLRLLPWRPDKHLPGICALTKRALARAAFLVFCFQSCWCLRFEMCKKNRGQTQDLYALNIRYQRLVKVFPLRRHTFFQITLRGNSKVEVWWKHLAATRSWGVRLSLPGKGAL